MTDERDGREWLDRVRAGAALQESEDRARVAAMTVSERLALGVELSMFAARMREAFREQSRAVRLGDDA